MGFFNILYILINIIVFFCAIYLIIVNSKKRKIYKQRAKELSQVSKSRECTQKEKELLKKYYHINIKDEKVCSTDYIFLEELTHSSNCDNNIINKRFIFNGAILICGLFFNYFYKRSKPKNFEYIVYKNNVYLVSVLFENSNVLHDLNMEHEFYYQYNVDNGLIEEGKYIITGFKASVLSLLVTISFLILLNFIDIKLDAILYVISMIFIYYSFIKDKRKSFIKYRKHNLTISIFTFINIILLLICLYDNNVMKAAIYSAFSKKERTINFQKDIDKEPLEIGQRVYLSGYRLCKDFICKKFIVLNKDLIFEKDRLIQSFFRNEDRFFFKIKKEKINILSGKSSAYYEIDSKKMITYLDKFKKYNLKSLKSFQDIIKKIVKNNDIVLLNSRSSDYYKYKDIFYNFRNELLNFEKNRLKNMKKEYFDKNAKTFFIRLNTDDNASYKRIYYQSKYYMIISNFEESKRMNNIEGVILDIKRQNGKDYVYIETSVSKEFLIGNLIILSIIILNLLIFCFNLIIYLFAKKKKRII